MAASRCHNTCCNQRSLRLEGSNSGNDNVPLTRAAPTHAVAAAAWQQTASQQQQRQREIVSETVHRHGGRGEARLCVVGGWSAYDTVAVLLGPQASVGVWHWFEHRPGITEHCSLKAQHVSCTLQPWAARHRHAAVRSAVYCTTAQWRRWLEVVLLAEHPRSMCAVLPM